MSAKYASYLNTVPSLDLPDLEDILQIQILKNVYSVLLVTFMTNGKKVIVELGGNGNECV